MLRPDEAVKLADAARRRAVRELRINLPIFFLTWGVTVVVSYGALWLAVRGEHHFHMPNGYVWGIVIPVVILGGTIRLRLLSQATDGVSGRSDAQQGIFVLSPIIASAGLWVLAAALAHAGASHSSVAIVAFAAPMLALGTILLASSAVHLDWSMFGLGVFLLVVTAGGAFAGPTALLLVYAVAGGGGFLVAAAVESRVRPR